jgi:oligopeptidase B
VSAGGLLVGGALVQRPDLFGAVVLNSPFVDVANTMLDESLPLTVHEYDEWGNPSGCPRALDYILRYSPYDNIRPGVAYPPVLVTCSLNDSRVGFWEGAKFVHRLRDRTAANAADCLLLARASGGHLGSGGRYDHLRDKALEIAFLHNAIGLDPR